MFIKSAASDTYQGKAIQAVNERWGEGGWNGRETIGITVCRKKYSPFSFTVENGPAGKAVKVERVFGCRCHSDIRRVKIEMHSVRNGWEPFGQWSMRKAQELARQETDRINGRAANTTANPEGDPVVLSSDEELKTMCHNGKCTWKMKAKYDNIYREITGHSESSDEE
jgi:hypothetical protein